MKKLCIFCGSPPIDKNKEHLIPKWLINLTGDPKRITVLGRKEGSDIKFSWLNYVFPACTKCNSNFAEIEGKVKVILTRLLEDKSVTHGEFDLFLDWLDKIRIGIWLGQAKLLEKQIDPKFHINTRVGQKDRLCLIYKTKEKEKGITITGTETRVFEDTPSCFGLIINDLAILNYSKEFILGKNLGFPYPTKYCYNSHLDIEIDSFVNGNSKVASRIITGRILKPTVRLYQSILTIKHGLQRPQFGQGRKFLLENCNTYTNMKVKSQIYIVNEFTGHSGFWKKGEKVTLKFPQKFDKELIAWGIAQMVFEYQSQSLRHTLKLLDVKDQGEKAKMISYYESTLAINESLAKDIKAALAMVTYELP